MFSKKRIILFLFATLFTILISSSVLAIGDFSVELVPITDKISIYESGYYFLKIKNNLGITERFQTYSPSIEWFVRVSPLTDEIFTLDDGEERRIKVEFNPTKYINPGQQYGVQVNVRALDSDILKKNFALMSVKSKFQITQEYQPALHVEVDSPEEIDPREKYQIKLNIENKNVLDITDMIITIDSKTQHLESMTSLGPLKQKTVLFTLSFDPKEAPISDHFKIRTYVMNKTVTDDAAPYDIIEYQDVQERVDKDKSFMARLTIITIKNNGNKAVTDEYVLPKSFIKRIFTDIDYPAEIRKVDKKRSYVFAYSLQPDETIQITVKSNYRIILYVIIVIVVLILLYYWLRSPLVAKKSVSSISTREGAISELKVMLHVRNRSSKMLEEVLVIDRIPRIIELINDFPIGTLKPIKVLPHDKKGTIVKWFIEGLEPFEERVITYRIKSNLNILGGLTLPLCIMKFKGKSGKEYMIHSNKVKIFLKKDQK